MVVRKAVGIAGLLAVLLLASPVEARSKFAHGGPYLGIGFGGASDFLENQLDDLLPGLNIKGTWTLNARAGYRVTSWFAVEVLYEGAYDFKYEYEDPNLDLGVDATFSTHNLVANLKFVAPTWRIQPYLLLGFGGQYAKWDDDFDLLDTGRWDFVFRPAVGIDGYITKHWVIFAEIAPSVRVAKWDDVPSEVTDNVQLTAGAGIQYRF